MACLTLHLLFITQRVILWAPAFLVLVGSWLWGVADLLLSGLTSSADRAGLYSIPSLGFTSSACTYEIRFGGSEFEWHGTALQPNTFFFSDVASLMYGLLMVVSTGVLLYLCTMGILGYYCGGYTMISYAYRAVVIRLIEH